MSSPQRLDEVCDISMGQAPNGEAYNYDGEGWPLIAGAGDFGELYPVVKKHTTTAARLSKHGDIVLGIRASIGEKVLSDGEYCLGRGVAGLRAKPNLSSRYLWHWLTDVGPRLALKAKGATFKQVNKDDIGELEIVLPSLTEQCRIAAILDQADALRAKRREALAQLDNLTQSIFVDMFGEFSTNSKNWKTCTVGDITDCIVPGRDKPKSFSGNIPWVTTSDLKHLGFTRGSSKGIGLSESEIKDVRARVIPSGSVIISCVGDLGIVSVAEVPMVVNQQLHSFQCHSNFSNIFLMYCLALQKPFMLAKASSTTLPYMNKTVCNSIPVICPPLALQQTFATRIQVVDSLKSTHRSALAELDDLFASFQHRAFRGEL